MTTDVRQSTLTPYLAVRGAAAALDFYVAVFGARRRGEPYVMPDGAIGHAELEVGESLLFLAEEAPSLGLLGPAARGGPSVGLLVLVADVDAVLARAVERGAVLVTGAEDTEHGRRARLDDPFGHRWLVMSRP